MIWLLGILLGLCVIVIAGGMMLRADGGLSRFEGDVEPEGWESFGGSAEPSAEHRAVETSIKSLRPEIEGLSLGGMMQFARKFMEDVSRGKEFDCDFVPVEANGVPCEWVLAPGADPDRRVLYLHGGAFFAGSPESHRTATSHFSRAIKASVLSVNYRLIPENQRRDGIEDCKTAYRWVLANGPQGGGAPDHIYVGGDSAGGNLSLVISNWTRDEGMRKPDAVVALSPLTDSTYSAPSLDSNMETDTMLGPLFGKLAKIPRFLLAWLYLYENRFKPNDPRVSPVMANLADLPPTLVQVSESEMLYDDARRYVNKARAASSPVHLQSWPGLVHVWQWYCSEVPEADDAWEKVREFIESVERQNSSPATS